ncbi:hypothetical protein ACSBR2_010054 [Camellia fascicularis]
MPLPSSSSLSRLCLHRRRVREHHCHRTRAPPSLRMRFHFDRLSPSSLISLKLSLDRPRISGPPLSQVSLLTENGNTKDDLRLATDDALLTQSSVGL